MEDNLSKQVEEIETLCSIYGPDWVTVDEASRSYSIKLIEDKREVSLYVTLPLEYPSGCPPSYELFAPELAGNVKHFITAELNSVYLDNVGDAVLFQWIEKLRDILRTVSPPEKSVLPTAVAIKEECCSKVEVKSSADLGPLVITHGPVIVDRKSSFQGHAAVIRSVDQARHVLTTLLENKKIANATHNMYAYRIENNVVPGAFLQDCDDDGETHAGARLMHLLQVVGAVNAVVVVSRWYGGVQLGPDRFRHINNAARQALEVAGLIVAHKGKPSH